MSTDLTIRAWIGLIVLSGVSVLIAAGAAGWLSAGAAGTLVLVFAWLKARVILSRYLGLWQAPVWLSGFNWTIGFYCLLLVVLFLIPAFVS